jgi:hypothetical protein
VAATCRRVTVPTTASTSSAAANTSSTITLYDCQGQASALRAAAAK